MIPGYAATKDMYASISAMFSGDEEELRRCIKPDQEAALNQKM